MSVSMRYRVWPGAASSARTTDWSTSPLDQVEDLLGGQVVGTTDGRGGLQVVSAGEHRGPRPEPLLELGAQVVGPLDAGAQ